MKLFNNNPSVSPSTQQSSHNHTSMHRLLEKLQACLELRRLEDRYVKRKDRLGFVSHATYVDGEYVYPSSLSQQSTSNSSKYSFATNSSASQAGKRSSRSWAYRSAIPSVGNWKR